MASVATFWTDGNGTSEEENHPKQEQQDHHLLYEPKQSLSTGQSTMTTTITTTTTPFQLAHRSRPRQITPPGASDASSPFMSSTETPSNPFGEGTNGTFAASVAVDSPLLKSPDGHSKRRTTEHQPSAMLQGVTRAAGGVLFLSLRAGDSPESWYGSAWTFATSPLKKKPKRCEGSTSFAIAEGGFNSPTALPPPSPYTKARILDIHTDQRVHRRDMVSCTNMEVSVPEKGSIQYDLWERMNLAAGEENILPFVRKKQERPSNMQRQYLLRLPRPNPQPKPEVATPLPPPSAMSTSPHVLYGWLHVRFAAGLVRSSFTMVHEMIRNDYDQARILLEKIHQNPDRSQGYISELLTLRDHLAGLWCVYAHFAMDVGRLARTIRDDAPFPNLRHGGGRRIDDEERLVAVVKEGSSTYGGTLRLQMINSPVPPSRKRRKSIKAAESEEIESQLEEEEDELNEVDEDEYIPTPPATTTTTAVKARRTKAAKARLASSHGSGLGRKKRPSPKSSSKGKKETTKVKTGHWTKAEHERFLEGIEIYGRGKWKLIAEVVKTRTTVQVKTHGQSVFALRENGGHHIQTLDKTPEQNKPVQRTMRTKKWTEVETENTAKDSNGDNSRRPGLRTNRGTVLFYDDEHEDQEEEEEEEGVDMNPAFVQHPVVATSVVHGTPQATGPSHMTSPFMGTTSMANLEDLILGGGLFSPSEFSQIDKLPTEATGETSEPDAPIAAAHGGSWQATDFVAASQIPSNCDTSVADAPMPPPCPPIIFDGFLDRIPPFMQGFFVSVGIFSTEQFLKTPTQTLAEIYMCYQRDQAQAVMSSVVTSDVTSRSDISAAATKKISSNEDAPFPTSGTYHDIVGHTLSILLAARKCPLVGNHHFIVLAMGRMIVSAAPMEKTPNGASSVDVPTAVLSTRINSAIAANWDAMKSCHGSAVDESGVFSQNPNSAERATALLACLDFCGKKLVSEDKVQSTALREEMKSITLLPQQLRKNASRPDGFVFNDCHATLALCWELNRWSRLEEQLRTNTSGKAMRLGESPWCQPTYQIEDLPMFANVDVITDAFNKRTYAEGNKDSETVVWEW